MFQHLYFLIFYHMKMYTSLTFRLVPQDSEDTVFTARVIHSLPLRQSVIQIYHGGNMNAISHLIGSEQLPKPNQVCNVASYWCKWFTLYHSDSLWYRYIVVEIWMLSHIWLAQSNCPNLGERSLICVLFIIRTMFKFNLTHPPVVGTMLRGHGLRINNYYYNSIIKVSFA